MKKVLLLLLILFVFSCENENESEVSESTTSQEVNKYTPLFFDAADLPEIMNRISTVSNKSISKLSGKTGDEPYTIDTENILGVTDSVGNKTYALRVYPKNGRTDAFYNLLVTERADGEDLPIAVLEYIREPDYFRDLAEGTLKEDGGYKQTVQYYGYFSNTLTSSSKATLETLGEPCGEVSSGSSGQSSSGTANAGGSSTSNTNSSSSGLASYGSVSGPRAGGYSGGGSPTGGSPKRRTGVEVGNGCFCALEKPKDEAPAQKGTKFASKEDDCPKGEIVIPVNEEEQIINDIDNPCAAKIIEKANLIDSEISDLINTTFGGSTKFDLILKEGVINNAHKANTDAKLDSNGNITSITITYNKNFLGVATDLSIFQTTIHEYVHVLIDAHLDTGLITINNDNLDLSIAAELWAEQTAKIRGGTYNPNAEDGMAFVHHEIISELVTEMAKATKKYGDKQGYNEDMHWYEALAWGGLTETSEYKKKENWETDFIEAVVGNEESAFELLATGKPCK